MGNKEVEKKYLKYIIRKMDNNKKHPITSFWLAAILWILLFLIVLGLSTLYHVGYIGVGILLLITGVTSCIAGCILIMRFSEQYWPYLKNHIDKQSISERINELEV